MSEEKNPSGDFGLCFAFLLGTGCSGKIVFFLRIFQIFRPLPRQHWAGIDRWDNSPPYHQGVTAHIKISSSPTHTLCFLSNFCILFKLKTIDMSFDLK